MADTTPDTGGDRPDTDVDADTGRRALDARSDPAFSDVVAAYARDDDPLSVVEAAGPGGDPASSGIPGVDGNPAAPSASSQTPGVEPFSSSMEHLLTELERIDLLIRVQVWRARQLGSDGAFRGLTISEEEVDAAFERPLGAPAWVDVPLPPEMQEIPALLDKLEAQAEARCQESRRRGLPLRLDRLRVAYGLSRFELDALLIVLAPELDQRYERLYAWLQDDVTRKRPTVDLVLNLLCESLIERLEARSRFLPDAPLCSNELIQLFSDPPQAHSTLLGRFLKIDDRIVAYLHGDNRIDIRLAPLVRHVQPTSSLRDLVLPTALKQRLAGLARNPSRLERDPFVVYLHGPPGVGRETTAAALCRKAKLDMLVLNGPALLATPEMQLEQILRLVLREARLLGAAIYWEGFDALLAPDKALVRNGVLHQLGDWRGLVFLSGETPWDPADALHDRHFMRVGIEPPDAKGRAELWVRHLGRSRLDPDVDLLRVGERFTFTSGQIRDAAATAKGLAAWRDADRPVVTMSDLWEACRRHGLPQLGALAQKVTTPFTWDDLVMPRDRVDRLREIVQQVRYRSTVYEDWGFQEKLATGRGLGMLFAGAPGTGKTMAAGVMARELELDLYQIDLSSVVSKYIGETEKHLAKIFDEAERSNVVLFFDEADALFGKRSEVKDAHDRYANIETSYLLQRVDAYDGVIILASNFIRNLDEAYMRRLRFIVEFALPDERERRRIWEQIWPMGVPREPDVDLAVLAKRFELAGGYIRNIALSAAFLAASDGGPVGMRHLMHAARREYQKMGKMVDESLFSYRRSVS